MISKCTHTTTLKRPSVPSYAEILAHSPVPRRRIILRVSSAVRCVRMLVCAWPPAVRAATRSDVIMAEVLFEVMVDAYMISKRMYTTFNLTSTLPLGRDIHRLTSSLPAHHPPTLQPASPTLALPTYSSSPALSVSPSFPYPQPRAAPESHPA